MTIVKDAKRDARLEESGPLREFRNSTLRLATYPGAGETCPRRANPGATAQITPANATPARIQPCTCMAGIAVASRLEMFPCSSITQNTKA